MFTCIECENSYDNRTGDVDERTCYECLDKRDVLDDMLTNDNICREETDRQEKEGSI